MVEDAPGEGNEMPRVRETTAARTAGDSAFADHLSAPRGRGALRDAPHSGAAGGAACGDLVRVAVRVVGERVAQAGFEASGCGAAQAAGSAVVELVEGAPLLEAARVTPARVSAALGGLSPGRYHAAELAADALHRALGAALRGGSARLPFSAGRSLVAMSGGVDSAVAAQLALAAHHEVVAVTLELWADPATDGERSCCSPQAVTGARALAHGMGLPHFTLDLRQEFRAAVVDDFLSEYGAGRTPNPCVRCNGLVRFDAMLALADTLGAGRLATGHYARIAHDADGPLVRAACDEAKDQSYMLARLTAGQLDRLWFPLGTLSKPEVRESARAAGLPVADRRESQDLCFLAGLGGRSFMRRHGQGALSPARARGEIVDRSGRTLGEHDGHHHFTVGQRRGIGLSAGEPLYVLRKDAGANRVVVGPRSALATRSVVLGGATLHRPGRAVDSVKLRYRAAPVRCRVLGEPPAGRHSRLALELERPVEAVAPGQVACLLAGDRVLGWATIADAEERRAA
jgi:tRNA-uridine 2-sulfurtransferase